MKFKPKHSGIFKALTLLVLIGLVSLVYFQRQNVRDWFILLTYKPPATIKQLATQDGMTSYTRRVFYVNHPQLDSKSTFASFCPNNSEQSVVLGCYHTGQNGIFLLSVNNPELYGLEQVTAAYETLHAIYQRLSPSAQSILNSELVSFENNGLNNPVVVAQIAGFRKTEPGGVLNEMTSLFGTEVQNLPNSLTKFYSKYFTNRQILLNYYNDYESAFTSRQQQIAAYDSQLSSLKSQITTDENQLNSQLSQINTEQSTLNEEKDSGLIDEYNDGVGSYNLQVNSYNSLAANTKNLVDQYNVIVGSRNSIVLQDQQLVQSITASPKSIANQ